MHRLGVFLERCNNGDSYQWQRDIEADMERERDRSGRVGQCLSFVQGDVLVREHLWNTFFRCYLYLVIMREADIPQRSVYILLLGPSVKEMQLAD